MDAMDDGTPISAQTAAARDELRAALRAQTELLERAASPSGAPFTVEEFDQIAIRIDEASKRYKFLWLADMLEAPMEGT